jgi:hypothetical protein
MKTYTLEELKAAQAKGCRIEYCDVDDGDWFVLGGDFAEKMSKAAAYKFRIHPADEWKARLPRLKGGAEGHRNDFTNEMLEGGYRPLLEGEACEQGDEVHLPLQDRWSDSGLDFGARMTSRHLHTRTRRPVPPEFLHPDELAKRPEAAPQPPCDCIEKCGKFWVQRCSCHNSGDLANAEAWCQEQNRHSEAAQAPDFGEPWECDGQLVFSRDEIVLIGHHRDDEGVAQIHRAVACTNALAGVPDPAEFVRQAKENAARLADIERRQQAEAIMQNHLDSHL